MSKGYFITFDGPEGSGKSSQCRLLGRAFEKAAVPVLALRDPGSTRLGLALRKILLQSGHALDARTETLLFWAGRVQLVTEQIVPALKGGKVVICDRYHDATVAYQGYGGILEADWVDRTGRSVIGNVMPDLTFLMDLPVESGFSRLKRNHDRMERKAMAYHKRVRRGYLDLARKEADRFCVIDAAQSRASIHRAVMHEALKRLPRRYGAKLTEAVE